MAKTVHIREEIPIPDGIDVSINKFSISVKGPKGEIQKDLSYVKGIQIKLEDGKIVLETFFADRERKAQLYSVIAHIRNMFTGVTKGWRYKLKIVSSHFPVTARVSGNEVLIDNFLGERAPRKAKILSGVSVKVDGKDIIIEGADLDAVAQTAANIELATRVKDKDRRVFVDGIYIYERGVAE